MGGRHRMRLGSATFCCFLGIDSCHKMKRRGPCRFTQSRIGSLLIGRGQIGFVRRMGDSLCRRTMSGGGVVCGCWVREVGGFIGFEFIIALILTIFTGIMACTRSGIISRMI